MNIPTKPQARRGDQLLLRQLPDELVIYDKTSDRAHCLNQPASELWSLCDGRSTKAELAEALARALGQPPDEQAVRSGLRQLAEARLLIGHGAGDGPFDPPPPTRREVLRCASRAAIALPLVISILAPTPAMAQSALPNGTPCTSSAQCASGCCNAGSQKCVGNGNCL